MATLTGKITDVTGRSPDSISSITVKAPSARIGSGTDVIVSSPAVVTFDKTTGNITISGLTGGLSWLYIEGDGWSDSIPLAVAEGMATLVEATANASGVPGIADYVEMLRSGESRVEQIADAASAAATQAAQVAEQAATSTSRDRAAVHNDREYVTTVAGQIDTAFTDSIPPYLQRTGLDDAYMRGSEYPLSGALEVLKARLMAKDIAPIVLVFAGSSTTEGSNVPLAHRWVTKIAEKATHEPVVSSYEAAVDAAPFHEGVTVVNMGRSGRNSGTYIRSEEAPVVGSWSPALVMHAVGANDASTTWGTPAVVAGYISSRIDAIDTASPLPVAHILLHQHERYDGELLAPWRDYWESLAGIATTRPNVSVINAADVFKALGVPGSDPLGLMESDKVHVNTKGHAIYSDLIGDVLDLPEKVDRTTTLFDDFNRPDNTDIAGDSPTIGPSGSVWESPTTPKLYIKNNRVAAMTGTAATALIDTGVADGDITVGFDFLTPGSSVAGVVFRATDINNRWGVYIGGADNEVELYRMIGGTNTVLTGATVDGAKYSKAGLATMRIRVKGQRITAWIDGVKVIEHTMTEAENAMSRTWSKVGFRVTGSVAEFDNLRVTSV